MIKNLESEQNKLFHKERINQNAIRLTQREKSLFSRKSFRTCVSMTTYDDNLFANKQPTTSNLQHRAFSNMYSKLLITVGEMIFKLELINAL